MLRIKMKKTNYKILYAIRSSSLFNPLTLFYTVTLYIYQMCIVYKISYKNEHILIYKHNFFQSEN